MKDFHLPRYMVTAPSRFLPLIWHELLQLVMTWPSLRQKWSRPMSTPDLFHLLTKIHHVIKPGKKTSFGSVRPFRLSKDRTQEFCISPNILKPLYRFEVCFQSNNFLYMQYAAEVLYVQMVWLFLHKVAPCCTLSLQKGTYVFDRHIWLLSKQTYSP